MNDLTSIVNAVFRVSLLLLSALFLGWALYPVFRPIIMGLIMGMAAGLFNVRFLSMKVQQLAQLAVDPKPKKYNFGFITRLCIGLLIVIFAVKLEQVSLGGAIAGLFIPQLLTIPVSIVFSLRNNH
ncbi:ATP synthase protein I [Paenibacillus sp. cl141a]|uniref:ATP synthase subunit I n=1 Tax=Paenibacillus sp. cl141a TaxID=1761877 RepID=UPI0008B542B8|nr:ATP synthase subunit I [Paenibacillus sp. cl141a]SEL30456.1 ATP synthase protein I [Paenibacillus sp. cl141a]